MGTLKENLLGAWSVLVGLKQATIPARHDITGDRIGSDPGIDDADVLSAAFSYFRHYTHLEPDRKSIYSDMDEMYQYVLAHSALEAYIEDAAQIDLGSGMSIWPIAENSRVTAEIIKLFEILDLENRITGDLWGMGKYGDHFLLLRYEAGIGVQDAVPIDPRICHRHETRTRILRGFDVSDVSTDDIGDSDSSPRFKPWDMVHYRIFGKRPTDKYGSPFFENVRLIYKVLKLMEEQMVIYRMNMHPDRLVFQIGTGSASPEERRRVIRMWRREFEKTVSFNHDTGRFTSEYSPWMINQNIYMPIGEGDQNTGVQKFDGSANSGDIFDVEYMRDLFFAGVRIPKAYLGFEDSQGYRGTDTLSAQSLKFARGVRRMQRHFLTGLMRLCKIHLALRGIPPNLPENKFELKMTPVSYLDEAHRAELYAKRFEAVNYMLDIGTKMSEQFEGKFNTQSWAIYVLKEFGQFDDQMIARLLTPVQGGEANLIYSPAGAAFRWENTSLNSEEILKLRGMISENSELKEIVTKILPTANTNFQSSYSSSCDTFDYSGILEKSKNHTTDSSLFDEAVTRDDNKRKSIPDELKKKKMEEMRQIAEAARQLALEREMA